MANPTNYNLDGATLQPSAISTKGSMARITSPKIDRDVHSDWMTGRERNSQTLPFRCTTQHVIRLLVSPQPVISGEITSHCQSAPDITSAGPQGGETGPVLTSSDPPFNISLPPPLVYI